MAVLSAMKLEGTNILLFFEELSSLKILCDFVN